MIYYLLWKYDVDGVPELVYKFTDRGHAMAVARILSSYDEYKDCVFCVEEF